MSQGGQVGMGLLARDASDSRDSCGYHAVNGRRNMSSDKAERH